MPRTWDPNSLPPDRGIQRLIEGNRRFVDSQANPSSVLHRPELAERGQRPFAVVLGCSDSRTPVEILFDQGLGDLFVVRVAGHVVAPSIVGSVEFAVSELGTRLVVVLGHSQCGAIAATVRALESGQGPESKNLRSITDRIAPHLREILELGSGRPRSELLHESMRANVRASADHLRHGSRLIEELVLATRVVIVGAEYQLDTGRVSFFEGI